MERIRINVVVTVTTEKELCDFRQEK